MRRLVPLLLFLAAAAASAPAAPWTPAATGQVAASLHARDATVRPGTPFPILLRLAIEEGWHVYAPDPGDAGLPTTVAWDLPPGFTAGEPRWPAPREYVDGGFTTRGYEGELLLVVEITPPRDLAAGAEATIRARVAWLACRTECIPGEAVLSLAVPVTALEPSPDPANASLFAAAGAAAAGVGTSRGGAAAGLLAALALAFVGGLILNLMPCVLPVLSLKVVGLARHGAANGLWYTLGVLVSFWAIAGALAALRAGGRMLGWGFQFQDPVVVAIVALLLFLLGLNLFGTYEVGLRAAGAAAGAAAGLGARRGRLASFAGGLFMTVVATPCTAPFMGAALGYAVAQPPLASFAVFTALGLGVALPYALLSTVPALARLLPKPGPWMETLKHAMGFPMMAAAAWFVGLAATLSGAAVVTPLLAALVVAGLGAWAWGRWGRLDRGRPSRVAAGLVALLAIGGAAAIVVAAVRAPGTAAGSAMPRPASPDAAWEAWSPERVDALVAAGTPVFVDFTAAWCLTCRVNEATTLNAPRVRAAFAERGVALLKADWTARDPRITRALEGFGRVGVPLYVLYPGDGGPAVLLPELLTPGIVRDALAGLPGD